MRTANQRAPVEGPTYANHANGDAHVEGPAVWQSSIELLNKSAVCRLFGNINPSTLYRGIREGRYPKPVRVGPNTSRWLLAECQAALRAMVEARS
jgi:predicted DNA-binding transcriptional regulator AlpA